MACPFWVRNTASKICLATHNTVSVWRITLRACRCVYVSAQLLVLCDKVCAGCYFWKERCVCLYLVREMCQRAKGYVQPSNLSPPMRWRMAGVDTLWR